MKKYIIFFLIVFILFIGYFAIFGKNGLIQARKLKKEKEKISQTINNIKKENSKLIDEIDKLRSNDKYIEEIARKELGLVKKDEFIYRFSNNEKRKRR
ncbi:MAG: septum formation initiator family protein [Deltaproteobacteria bacterium]|nr:septum formation initiator family protein [Deltaproteobacteria bacterium]RLA89199.1 MAG: septum formation initiator family protein [Deltaproteobacteria bacterium]